MPIAMKPIDVEASMVIHGDVILDEGSRPLLVLHRENKLVDNRIRFVLMTPEGERVHRTLTPYTPLRIEPLGMARVMRDSIALSQAMDHLLEIEG